MKKINISFGFTLIELLVVISIFTIITSTWIIYFIQFSKQQEVDQITQRLDNIYQSYDQDIRDKKIYDYHINLSPGQNSIWFLISFNEFDLSFPQVVNYDFSSNLASIIRTGTWNIELYKDIKLFRRSQYLSSPQIYTLSWATQYSILWDSNDTKLNTVDIVYYDKINIDNTADNDILFNAINTNEDFSGIDITNLSIKNINGKKNLSADWSLISSAWLFFEYAWVSSKINITN